MSLIDWLNALIVGNMRGGDKVATMVGDELIVGQTRQPLSSVATILAYEADIHTGNVIVLALSFRDGTTVQISQTMPCWDDVVRALDRLGLTQMRSEEWLTAIIAGSGKAQPIILRSLI